MGERGICHRLEKCKKRQWRHFWCCSRCSWCPWWRPALASETGTGSCLSRKTSWTKLWMLHLRRRERSTSGTSPNPTPVWPSAWVSVVAPSLLCQEKSKCEQSRTDQSSCEWFNSTVRGYILLQAQSTIAHQSPIVSSAEQWTTVSQCIHRAGACQCQPRRNPPFWVTWQHWLQDLFGAVGEPGCTNRVIRRRPKGYERNCMENLWGNWTQNLHHWSNPNVVWRDQPRVSSSARRCALYDDSLTATRTVGALGSGNLRCWRHNHCSQCTTQVDRQHFWSHMFVVQCTPLLVGESKRWYNNIGAKPLWKSELLWVAWTRLMPQSNVRCIQDMRGKSRKSCFQSPLLCKFPSPDSASPWTRSCQAMRLQLWSSHPPNSWRFCFQLCPEPCSVPSWEWQVKSVVHHRCLSCDQDLRPQVNVLLP